MSRDSAKNESEQIEFCLNVKKAALKSAVAIFSEIFPSGNLPEDMSDEIVAVSVLKATVEVRSRFRLGREEQEKKFGNDETDLVPELFSEEIDVVASALWIAAFGHGVDVDEVHPESLAGTVFTGFAHAVKLMEFVAEANGAIWELVNGQQMVMANGAQRALTLIEHEKESK